MSLYYQHYLSLLTSSSRMPRTPSLLQKGIRSFLAQMPSKMSQWNLIRVKSYFLLFWWCQWLVIIFNDQVIYDTFLKCRHSPNLLIPEVLIYVVTFEIKAECLVNLYTVRIWHDLSHIETEMGPLCFTQEAAVFLNDGVGTSVSYDGCQGPLTMIADEVVHLNEAALFGHCSLALRILFWQPCNGRQASIVVWQEHPTGDFVYLSYFIPVVACKSFVARHAQTIHCCL